MEAKIADLEAQTTLVETSLLAVAPENYTQVQNLYEQMEVLKQAIDIATERWLELAEIDV